MNMILTWREQLPTLKHSVAMKVRLKVREPKRARPAMGRVKLSTTNWMALAWVFKIRSYGCWLISAVRI